MCVTFRVRLVLRRLRSLTGLGLCTQRLGSSLRSDTGLGLGFGMCVLLLLFANFVGYLTLSNDGFVSLAVSLSLSLSSFFVACASFNFMRFFFTFLFITFHFALLRFCIF